MSGVQPASRPALAGTLTIGGSLVDRAAWRAAGLAFGPGDDWLIAPTMARFLMGVARVDVLDQQTYTWLPDHGTRPFGATPSALAHLSSWRRVVAAVDDTLVGSPLADGWERHVAGIELPRLLQDAERATAEQWAELHDLAASYDERPGVTVDLPVAARSLVWLAAHDRRAEVEALAAEVAELGDDLRTRIVGSGVVVGWQAVELPDEVRRLPPVETQLRTHVHRSRLVEDEREVELFLEVAHVDLGDPDHPVLVLVQDASGAELTTRRLAPAEATRWAGRRFQAAVAVAVRVPCDLDLVQLTVTAGEVQRTGVVRLVPTPAQHSPGTVVVEGLALAGSVLQVATPATPAEVALLDPAGRPCPVAFAPTSAGVEVELRADHFGAPTWLAPGGYRLVSDPDSGTPVVLSEDLRGRLPLDLAGPRHRVRAHLGPRGGLVLGLGPPLADDELGPHAQERLRAAYSLDERPVDPDLFYFETYAGRGATDSPLAIYEELRRRRPGLRARWGIADPGSASPRAPSRSCSAAVSGTTSSRGPGAWCSTPMSRRGSGVGRGSSCCRPSTAIRPRRWGPDSGGRWISPPRGSRRSGPVVSTPGVRSSRRRPR